MDLGAPAYWLMVETFFVSPVHWIVAIIILLVGAGVCGALYATTRDDEEWAYMLPVVLVALMWPLGALVLVYLGPVVLAGAGVAWVAYKTAQEVMKARGTLPTPEALEERKREKDRLERYHTWAD